MPWLDLAYTQDDVNLHILYLLKDTISLLVVHMEHLINKLLHQLITFDNILDFYFTEFMEIP